VYLPDVPRAAYQDLEDTTMSTRQAKSRLFRTAMFLLLGIVAGMQAENNASVEKPTTREGKSAPSIYALLYVATKPGVTDLDSYRRDQAASFKSIPVLYGALEEPKVADLKVVKAAAKPADWLRAHIQTEFVDTDGHFRLSVTGASPEEQAILVNAIAKAHLRMEEPLREILLKAVKSYKDSLPSYRAGVKEKEAWLSKEELAKLPEQIRINPEDYIKGIRKEIEHQKATIKMIEKDIEDDEKLLEAMPWVRVVKWAKVPESK
jgi:hypothetical protein